MLPSMYSTPGGNLNQPCWHCTHFIALVYQGTAARCARADKQSIQAAPTTGCAFWQREPGVDDEPGPPAGASFSSPWTAADATAARMLPPFEQVRWAP